MSTTTTQPRITADPADAVDVILHGGTFETTINGLPGSTIAFIGDRDYTEVRAHTAEGHWLGASVTIRSPRMGFDLAVEPGCITHSSSSSSADPGDVHATIAVLTWCCEVLAILEVEIAPRIADEVEAYKVRRAEAEAEAAKRRAALDRREADACAALGHQVRVTVPGRKAPVTGVLAMVADRKLTLERPGGDRTYNVADVTMLEAKYESGYTEVTLTSVEA